MKKSLIYTALSIAINKMEYHPELDRFIHYTFIVQDNKIIEWGRNNKRSPARHFGYHNRISDFNFGPKTHSEIDAYKKAKGLLNKNKKFEIINVRLNKNKELRSSKPCEFCYNIMKKLGCERFVFSCDERFESSS